LSGNELPAISKQQDVVRHFGQKKLKEYIMKIDNEEYQYSCTINDQEFNYEFKIIARFNEKLTECPVCGSNECCGGKEKFLWAEFDGEKLAIHFEDGEFENYLSYWYYEGISENEYKSLPKFLKEHNEGIGWDDWNEVNPNSIIDALDFINAMDIIKNSRSITENDSFLTKFYPVIIEFTNRVINENKVLNILKE
jgi:hypothetical protein